MVHSVLAVAALLGSPSAMDLVSHGSVQDTSRYEVVFEQLMALAPDPARTAVLSNVTIKRDAGVFTLANGTFSFLSPVGQRTMGGVFVGEGTFSFTAPLEVERGQLRRFYEADSIHVPIRRLAFLFADSTAQELSAAASFGNGTPHNDARNAIRDALEYIADDDSHGFDRSIMTAALNDIDNGVFYAHIVPERGDPMFFMVNPYNEEQISLSRPAKGRDKYRETVSRFAAGSLTGTAVPAGAGPVSLLQLDNYVIESTIEDNLDFSASAEFAVEVADADHHWVALDLFYELEVDSARWDDGTPASFFRGKESGTLWINAAPAHTVNGRRLTVYYQGKLMERVRDWMVYVQSSAGWYPRTGDRANTTFDMTFHSPEKYVLVSVGERIQDEINNKQRTTRWVTPAVKHVTFNLGEFEEHEFKDPRIPPVKLQVAQQAHESMTGQAALNDMYIPLQQDIGEMVGADLTNSLAFYQRVFGPAPVHAFTGTEIPYLHGQAFPGLVLLSWVTFQWTTDKGYDDIFRAHEVAHQWWGIGVDVETYHDRWLSEGMSDFAGLWYMETIRMDREMYEKRLNEMKEDILERRDKAGPIWLGDRVSNSEYPEDYQNIIYKKGAWVMHMLRFLMRDLDTMDEATFVKLMQDFYASNLGGTASTEEFRETVERHLGIPMDWFFNQWVYGTEIPKFNVAYRYEDTADGQVQATVRVRTEHVSPDFKMFVPIHLDFGADGWARLRILIEEPEAEIDLPLLPKKPNRIVFNDFEAVLAEVDYEGW
jgi:hypothetical protein